MRKNNNVEDVAEDAPQKMDSEFEKVLRELDELSDGGSCRITGRIYRLLNTPDQPGRQVTELCGVVEQFVDEDYVGRHYGGGRYKVRYRVKPNDGSPAVDRNFIYTIGREYDKYKAALNSLSNEPSRLANENAMVGLSSPGRGGFLDSILNSLTAEKITAYSVAIKTIREIFAPPPPPDFAAIIQAIAALKSEPKPALSDTIVTNAMEMMRQQNRQPTFLEQLNELEKVKEVLKKDIDNSDEKEDGEMNLILKSALQYLPILLQKNNGNYQAVGQEAAQNPVISELVKNDPDVARAFLDSVRDKYGMDAAQKIAAGFNYEYLDEPEESGAEAVANG